MGIGKLWGCLLEEEFAEALELSNVGFVLGRAA